MAPPAHPSDVDRRTDPRGTDMAVLTVNDLCKTFGAGTARSNRVLDHITFDVRGQTFVSIVAPPGAAKTTLLNITPGVETHPPGDIPAPSDPGKPARLGYVF